MEIVLYRNFHKKQNSTKRPTNDPLDPGIYHVTGILKEPCSVMRPMISIQNVSALDSAFDMHTLCTYCYIEKFHRYYFIEDWNWNNGLWTVSMTVDVLASFKTEIGNHREYILRTDSDQIFDGSITDTTYPATTDFDIEDRALLSENGFVNDINDGCYIVGVISNDSSNAVGAITYYAMTPSEFGDLKDVLLSDVNLEEMDIIDNQGVELIQDVSTQLLKTLYNPYQYIASCLWFPFGVSDIPNSTSVSDIPLGWWVYHNLTAHAIEAQLIEFEEITELPIHPQALDRGEYLNYAPYTKRSIIGKFGTLPIDTSYYKLGDMLSVQYLVDIISGQCRANIRIYTEPETPVTPEYTTIAQRGFLIGVPIQLAQIGRDYLGTATSVLHSAGGIVSNIATENLGGLISTVASGIYDTVKSSMPQMETSGQNGTFITPFIETHLVSHFFRIVEEDLTHRGRPVCKKMFIQLLSGYVLCAEGDVEISCYDNERKQISKFLTTGFYWE